eukprot:10080845-Alexandrium_andersonii.AAC.1
METPPASQRSSAAAEPASSSNDLPRGRLIGRKLPWARAPLATRPPAVTAATSSSAASVPAMGSQQPTAPATGSRRRLVLRPSRESFSQLSDEPASQAPSDHPLEEE